MVQTLINKISQLTKEGPRAFHARTGGDLDEVLQNLTNEAARRLASQLTK